MLIYPSMYVLLALLSPADAAPSCCAGGVAGPEPIILGAIDRADVDAVVKAALPDLRACYRSALAAHPDLAGRITTKFYILAGGAVDNVSVKSTTMNSEPVETCVTNVVATLHFPSPRGGGIAIVSYPLFFSPG